MMKKHAGFTLVELLVVIAILSVLAAILLPGLMRSLDMARSTYCQNNLRQMGLCTMNYANDSGGWILHNDYTYSNPYRGTEGLKSFHALMAYLDYLPHDVYSTSSPKGYRFFYTGTPPVLTHYYYPPMNPFHCCPSIPFTVNAPWRNQNSNYGIYGMRGAFTDGVCYNLSNAPIFRRNANSASVGHKNPYSTGYHASRYVLWGDSYWFNQTAITPVPSQIGAISESATNGVTTSMTLSAPFHLRHLEGGNGWFADGHTKNLSRGDLVTEKLGLFASTYSWNW